MISSVVPEFVGGGVRKSRGNSASFWLLDSLLAFSTHPVVFDVMAWVCGQLLFSSLRNLWYWSPSGGTSDFISFYCYFSFSARQLPPLSKMPSSGCDPGPPLPVTTTPASCSGACQIPNRLSACSEMGCHLLLDVEVLIQLGAFSELPVLWSYRQQRLRVTQRLLLLKLVPRAVAALWWLWGWQLLLTGFLTGFGVWIQLRGLWLKCLGVVEQSLTIIHSLTIVKVPWKLEQWYYRIVPTCFGRLGQTAAPWTCEPYL